MSFLFSWNWWTGQDAAAAAPVAATPATTAPAVAEPSAPRRVPERLPRKIALSRLMDGSEREYVVACLAEKGFAVLTFDDDGDEAAAAAAAAAAPTVAATTTASTTTTTTTTTTRTAATAQLQALYGAGATFFGLPEAQRRECSPAENLNLGYVPCGTVREYLKLRPSDDAALWPAAHVPAFRPAFDAVFALLHSAAWAVFTAVAETPVRDSRSGAERRLLEADQVAAIGEFTAAKSNISLIHYYRTAVDDVVCSCSEHRDTGLVTVIVAGTVPGLEVCDRATREWIAVEAAVRPTDLLVILGEKIPAFGCTRTFEGTNHRVMMPPHTERTSMVFLLDVAK